MDLTPLSDAESFSKCKSAMSNSTKCLKSTRLWRKCDWWRNDWISSKRTIVARLSNPKRKTRRRARWPTSAYMLADSLYKQLNSCKSPFTWQKRCNRSVNLPWWHSSPRSPNATSTSSRVEICSPSCNKTSKTVEQHTKTFSRQQSLFWIKTASSLKNLKAVLLPMPKLKSEIKITYVKSVKISFYQ